MPPVLPPSPFRRRIVLAQARLGDRRTALAARGERPAAFGRRCIPADCVAPPSNIPDILGRRALSAGRLAALGATPDFHHGLLGGALSKPTPRSRAARTSPPRAARCRAPNRCPR